jgi:hypothetical protein
MLKIYGCRRKIMELKTFVSETLKQIVEGVKQAQEDVKNLGATVNPSNTANAEKQLYLTNTTRRTAQVIDFDISLTETEATQTGGSIGVFFGSVGLGAHGKAESGSNAMNRVKFSIPVALPAHFCP